jgi:hypothetical protein
MTWEKKGFHAKARRQMVENPLCYFEEAKLSRSSMVVHLIHCTLHERKKCACFLTSALKEKSAVVVMTLLLGLGNCWMKENSDFSPQMSKGLINLLITLSQCYKQF